MDIRNHKIDSIWYKQTSNLSSGTIDPKFVVTHYTTGWSGQSSRDWLLGAAGNTDNSATSAHVVIDRDGTAWQIAPFNRRAWHAGPSRYAGLSDINTYSVGLEFVNPGWMRPDGHGRWVDDNGVRKTSQELEAFGGFIEQEHHRVGSGRFAWPNFTPAQIATGLAITRAIVEKYSIQAIITHEEIDTRGWKTDPGPAFPQQSFKDLLDGGPSPLALSEYTVSATRLNLRGGPGTEFETMTPPGYLPRDTVVEIIGADGNWAFVEVLATPSELEGLTVGLRGWVHRQYLDLRLV